MAKIDDILNLALKLRYQQKPPKSLISSSYLNYSKIKIFQPRGSHSAVFWQITVKLVPLLIFAVIKPLRPQPEHALSAQTKLAFWDKHPGSLLASSIADLTFHRGGDLSQVNR